MIQSDKCRMEETMRQMEELLRKKAYLEKQLYRSSLEEILFDFEEEDLVEIAEEKGVKGVLKCRKNTLVSKLAKHMLQAYVMEPYFLCLQDREIEAFETVMESDEPCREPERVF